MDSHILTASSREVCHKTLTKSERNIYAGDVTQAAKYPMRLVTRRTGLTSHLIRAWERRHNAIQPRRTSTNRRLYSDEDIERLILLRDATSSGHSIGQIAELPTEELRRLAADAAVATAAASSSASARVRAQTFHREALAAVSAFDPERLESVLSRAAVSLNQTEWIERIIVPLLHDIGDRWEDGSLGVANEHLASAVVRTLLGRINEAIRREEAAPRIVITTPTGQRHELGALLATVTAASEGWNSIYLGANLPAREIASAARMRRARAVGLSLVYPEKDPELEAELRDLRRRLGQDVPIFVGGRASPHFNELWSEIGAIVIHNLPELREALQRQRLN